MAAARAVAITTRAGLSKSLAPCRSGDGQINTGALARRGTRRQLQPAHAIAAQINRAVPAERT